MTQPSDTPVVCCDLDGVIWRGETAIPGSAGAVAALRNAGFRVGFLSNNSSMTIGDVVEKLGRVGVAADPGDVLTSALAAAELVATRLAPGSRVLVCGGPGIREALGLAGFELVDEGPAGAVVVGLDRAFTFDRLARAAAAVRAGACFVATNTDATYPVAGGLLPGAGAMVAAVAVASGVEPVVAGKPHPPAADLVRRRLGSHGVVVGDRPSTDGALADMLQWPFALVLSGVTRIEPGPGEEPVPERAPPFVAADLAALVPDLVRSLAAHG